MRWFAVLLLSLALVAPSGTAGAAERRPPLQTAYMVGLDIHTPSGRVVHVPRPRKPNQYTELYGRTPDGWLVEVNCAMFLVKGGVATRVREAYGCGSNYYNTNLLSEDGRHFFMSEDQQGAGIAVGWVGFGEQDGGTHGAIYVDGSASPSAATGETLYISGYKVFHTADVTTGDVTKVLDTSTGLVDVPNDVLFVSTGRGWEGPTSLSDPGKPPWRKLDFAATDVSPGGTYVLGYGEVDLEVRRMSDGSLVRRLHRPDPDSYSEAIGWGSDDTVVMVKAFGEKRALVRCRVPQGRCVQVTSRTRLSVTLPTSAVGPELGA